MKYELPDELNVRHKGRDVPYELHVPDAALKRSLGMMMLDKEADWGIEQFVASIDGQPAAQAPPMLQWKVWVDAEDFLTHLHRAIGKEDSRYAPPMRDSDPLPASG